MNLLRANLVLAVAAAGLAVPTWLTIQADRTDFTSFEEIPKLFAGFTPENVQIIQVATVKLDENGEPAKDENGNVLRDTLQLQRADGEWLLANTDIAGVKVRSEVVREKVFDHLERIRVDRKAIVREDASPEELREFGLAEDQAIIVQCFDAARRPVAQLLIGNDAAGGKAGEEVVRGFFVRSADSSDVVLYEQLYWLINTDRDQWVDRTPLRFEVDQVVRMTLHNPKGDVVLTRAGVDSPDWQRESGPDNVGAVRNGEVRAFVQTMSQLQVQRFVKRLPPPGPQRDAAVAEYGLASPSVSVSLGMGDGSEYQIAVGSQVPGQNEYYVAIASVDFLLAVGDWITSPLERDPTSFFDPPPSRISAEPGEQQPPAETTESTKEDDVEKPPAPGDQPKVDEPRKDG